MITKIIQNISLSANQVKTVSFQVPKGAEKSEILIFGEGQFYFSGTHSNRKENIISHSKLTLKNPTILMPLPKLNNSELEALNRVQDNKRRFSLECKKSSVLKLTVRAITATNIQILILY